MLKPESLAALRGAGVCVCVGGIFLLPKSRYLCPRLSYGHEHPLQAIHLALIVQMAKYCMSKVKSGFPNTIPFKHFLQASF